MNSLINAKTLERFQDVFLELNHFEVAFYIVVAIISFAVLLCFFKNLLIVIMRILGLSHPEHYHALPRLPWRTLFHYIMQFQAWRERVFHFSKRSTGGFAGLLSTLSNLYTPDKVFIGRAYGLGLPLLQPLGVKVTRHIKIFAMTGAGKTTLLITMLCCWGGSAFLIDPKGQITNALASKDKKRKWLVHDAYGITQHKSIHFNVIDILTASLVSGGISAAVLWAHRIAACLIITPEGVKSPYFYDISREFIVGLILFMILKHPPEHQNLPFMRYLIVNGYRLQDPETGREETQGKEAFILLLDIMFECDEFNGTIAGAAKAVHNAGEETFGNILSTLLEETNWLDIPAIAQTLLYSDIDLSELKTRDDIVFSLVAPVHGIREEFKQCFRLFINSAAYVFEATSKKKGQCLFVVDEMPSLGHNPVLEVVLPVARSQGITFCGISQDTENLKKSYPKTWEGFIGNADIVIWMGTNHETTLAYLSRILGSRTIIDKDPDTGRKTYRDIKVSEPDQLRRFLDPDGGRMIITRAGKRAIRVVNDAYYKALSVFNYDADPDHCETLFRSIIRFLFLQHKKRPKKSSQTSTHLSSEEKPDA